MNYNHIGAYKLDKILLPKSYSTTSAIITSKCLNN